MTGLPLPDDARVTLTVGQLRDMIEGRATTKPGRRVEGVFFAQGVASAPHLTTGRHAKSTQDVPRAQLTAVRRILAEAEALLEADDDDEYRDDPVGDAEKLANRAKKLGGHSAARGLRWWANWEAYERFNGDGWCFSQHALDAVRRWVERVERRALREWGVDHG